MNSPIGAFNVKKSNHVVGRISKEFRQCTCIALSTIIRMTYTKHRSTQETLERLDALELDTLRSTNDDLVRKFGWQNDSDLINKGHLSEYKRLCMIIWQLFEEPRSSKVSKVNDKHDFACDRHVKMTFELDAFIHINHIHSFINNNIRSSNSIGISNRRNRFHRCLHRR
jgi:hypothetical protein